MSRRIANKSRLELETADLVVDAVYQGGRAGHAGDDPLGPLLGVSNQGGFRHLGSRKCPRMIVITTSMNEPDWPDHLDLETGLFTYFGDNRQAGRGLHDTPRWGNEMLRDLFARAHGGKEMREKVPPIFVFASVGTYRDARFLGLAVPGAAGMPAADDLVAVWHHSGGQRFQNYRAVFTVLDIPRVKRAWINDLRNENLRSSREPHAWKEWIRGGQPEPLKSTPSTSIRSRAEQLPEVPSDIKMLATIHQRFCKRPHDFELCAARIAEMMLPEIMNIDVTRPSRDGGRDAVGAYRIGFEGNAIDVDFALEAKCFAPTTSVGVKATSRLISRLRHRQFGILLTTSFVNTQAYREIRDDGHPILIASGRDIVTILKRAGIRDSDAVADWIETL